MLQRDASFTKTKVKTGTSGGAAARSTRSGSSCRGAPTFRCTLAAAASEAAVDAVVDAPENPPVSGSRAGIAIVIGALLAGGTLLPTFVDDPVQGRVGGFEAGNRLARFPLAPRDGRCVLAAQQIARAESDTQQLQALQEAASRQPLLVQFLLVRLGALMVFVAIIAH